MTDDKLERLRRDLVESENFMPCEKRIAAALERVLALRDEMMGTPATTDDGSIIVQCGLNLDRALRGEGGSDAD